MRQKAADPLSFSLEGAIIIMPQPLWDITWNIVGGLVVAFLTLSVQWIIKKLKCRSFRQVFGNDLDDFYMVYPSYESPSKDTIFPKPPSKVPRPSIPTINLTTVNSNAITRSISHLSYAFGNYSPSLPHIGSDIDIDQRMDISFLSLGGVNNYKSLDIFENTSNIFLQFGGGGIQSKTLGESIAKIEGKMDYGLILKIHPANNPNRTWLCVAGIGEWGTSGASWWLSRHWGIIYKHAKDKSFACITKTIYGSDDSTSLVHLFLSKEDVENTVKNTSNKSIKGTH
jgi:hypothetical protein